MGRGTRFRLGIAVSAVGQGLREAARYFGWAALCRVCLSLPPAGDRYPRYGSITRSRAVEDYQARDLRTGARNRSLGLSRLRTGRRSRGDVRDLLGSEPTEGH